MPHPASQDSTLISRSSQWAKIAAFRVVTGKHSLVSNDLGSSKSMWPFAFTSAVMNVLASICTGKGKVTRTEQLSHCVLGNMVVPLMTGAPVDTPKQPVPPPQGVGVAVGAPAIVSNTELSAPRLSG